MRAINLLPRDANEGRRLPSPPALVACGGTVLITLFLAISFLSASSNLAKKQAALTDAQTRLAVIPPPVAAALQERWHFYTWDERTGEVRWMCSWDTTPEDVDAFAAAIAQVVAGARA
jgi:hypothetical protein